MKCGVERFLVPFCPLCQRHSNFSKQKFMFREEMNCKGNDVQDIAIYSSTSSVNMLFTLFSFPNLLSFTWNNPFSLWALPFSACSPSENANQHLGYSFSDISAEIWKIGWVESSAGVLLDQETSTYTQKCKDIFFTPLLPLLWDKRLTGWIFFLGGGHKNVNVKWNFEKCLS